MGIGWSIEGSSKLTKTQPLAGVMGVYTLITNTLLISSWFLGKFR